MGSKSIFNRFLGKNFPKNLNPPYFCGEFDCSSCDGFCIKACERELLNFNENKDGIKFEILDFGCNFCQKCALACMEFGNDVLNLKFDAKINAKFKINANSCLAWNGVVCYSCSDICAFNAIEYFGMFRPIINDKCTGCGECINACFNACIDFKIL